MTNPVESTLNTAQVTLTEFLRARIDEDEAVALAAPGGPWNSTADAQVVAGYGSPVDGEQLADCFHVDPAGDAIPVHIARHDPTRVLAECEAKRRIVGRHKPRAGITCLGCGELRPCPDLRDLASVHSDHPDYRDEWRP